MRRLALLLILGFCLGIYATPTQAQGAWQPTGLTQDTRKLFTPVSGAFFAVTAQGLERSDDGGVTWASVSLPPQKSGSTTNAVAVTPTDHTRLFAMGEEGLYRSTDDAATWTLVLPTAEAARGIAISPADPSVVYIGLARPAISADFTFLRSRDGGDTWELIEEHHNSLCGWGIAVLEPHASDPGRVHRVAECTAGRDFSMPVRILRDFETSWTLFYSPGRESFFSQHLTGGSGAQAQRYYVAGRRDQRVGGGPFIARSDDDGATWTTVHSPTGFAGPNPTAEGPEPLIRGIVADPLNADRVFMAVSSVVATTPERVSIYNGSVQISNDAGHTWQPLTPDDLGEIHALALGIDGRNLYAATKTGVWQYALSAP